MLRAKQVQEAQILNVGILCSFGVYLIANSLPTVSEAQKRLFREQPDEYMQYRKEVEDELNRRFALVSHREQESREI